MKSCSPHWSSHCGSVGPWPPRPQWSAWSRRAWRGGFRQPTGGMGRIKHDKPQKKTTVSMNLMIFYNFYNDIRWDLIGTYEHFMIFMGTSWDIGFNQPKRFRHPQPGDTWCFMNPGWSLQDYDELWEVHCGSLLKYGLGAEHDLWSLWYFYNGEMIWYTKTMNWVCLSMGNSEYRYEKMTNNDKIWGLISGKSVNCYMICIWCYIATSSISH